MYIFKNKSTKEPPAFQKSLMNIRLC